MNNQKGIIVRRTYVRFKEGVAGGTAGHITTDVVSSNLDQGEVCNIM
jgi:hypothetical protein